MATHYHNGVGVHDTVRTMKVRCINNINIKGMSDQPVPLFFLGGPL